MADNTGAPHFIPYVEPTDLVREYPAADEASAFAVAAALDAIPVLAGIGSNVVQGAKLDVQTITSNVFAPITGLSAEITLTSATSKVLVFGHLTIGIQGNSSVEAYFRLMRDTTAVLVNNASSRPATGGNVGQTSFGANSSNAFVFVDSPATTDPVTYTLQAGTQGGASVRINFLRDDFVSRATSTITLIEVAA